MSVHPEQRRAERLKPTGPRVGIAIGLAAAICALLGTALAPRGVAAVTPPCWTAKRAYLTSATINHFTHRKFTHWLSARYSGYPRNYVGKPPPDVKLFISGRTNGFLINISLKGKYRRENNAAARKLGYPIGRWPMVPLFGRIVVDHRGILEVYEDNWVWKSTKGAKSYMREMADTGGKRFAVGLGDASLGVVYRQAKPTQEKGVQVVVRLGAMAMRLSLEGGREVNRKKATRLAQEALTKARGACHLS